ncbi:MAG: DUF222 domain-containing protein [Acidimicrobiales bacterium]
MGTDVSSGVVAKEARGALADLAARDLTGLTDAEIEEHAVVTAELLRLAEAAHVAALARLDVSGAWAPSGARSAAHYVGWKGHLPLPRAKALQRCGRQLRELPATAEAFASGRITVDHVRLLAHAHHKAPEAFAQDEVRLVERAATLLYSSFETVIRYWIHRNDTDDTEADAASQFAQRRVDCSETFEGTVVIDALLDPITGAIVARELVRLEQELFEADWAEARQRLGDAACATDLARTPKQRRADALRIMAERSAAKPAGATEPRVLLQVLAGDKSVERMCELSNGTVVTPGQLVPLLHWADVERIIFDGPSKVIDVGVRRRLFTGATRTAVHARDRGCTHPSCDEPIDRCQVDHVIPYSRGGLTTQANGQDKCRFHNHHKADRPPQPAA